MQRAKVMVGRSMNDVSGGYSLATDGHCMVLLHKLIELGIARELGVSAFLPTEAVCFSLEYNDR
jgi:hypothetical protein